MDHSEFEIGSEFLMSGRTYRCTDKGTRTVAAIRVDEVTSVVTNHNRTAEHRNTMTRLEAEAEGWFNGPPYAVAEILLDENDQEACEPVPGGGE